MSQVFPSRAAAKDWAARQEFLILNAAGLPPEGTVRDLFDRYAREVSPKHRGERWEIIRLELIGKDKLAAIRIADLRPGDLADWRDRRLGQVSPGSVLREMQLLSAVLNTARKEWGLLKANPMADVKRPATPPPRERRPTADELERLQLSAGEDLTAATARAYHAFRFAIETAMRAGEILSLEWSRVDLDRRVAHLPKTKNGRPRDVPLSTEAVRLLEALPLPRTDPVFQLTSGQLDALWRKLRERAAVTGLTFHDSRHEAITRLSKKLDVLALARTVGHRDLRMLQVYYNESAEELAKRLD